MKKRKRPEAVSGLLLFGNLQREGGLFGHKALGQGHHPAWAGAFFKEDEGQGSLLAGDNAFDANYNCQL